MRFRTSLVPTLAVLAALAACGEMPTEAPKVANDGITQVAVMASATNVFESGSHVKTWDPILPATAYPSWNTTVCVNTPAVGLSANWQNPHNAFAFGTSHPWYTWFATEPWWFVSPWINAYNDLASVGPGGHNWTRYQTTVAGNGSFVIRLIADNCSWIYLDGTLVGVQTTDLSTNAYGLTLNGTHTLDFIVFDGGGANGGQFRLETTTNPPPPLNPDLDGDGHPNELDAYPLDPTRWQLTLTGRVRDFKAYHEAGGHPDFERYIGNDAGIVKSTLDADRLPVYARATGGSSTTTGKAEFDQWYRDVPGVNLAANYDLLLTKNANGTFTYTNPNYFPIDGQLFGNYSYNNYAHNFHFTTEIHTNFAYRGGETFSFTGDDDVWVFINGKLAIDLGGVHGPATASVNLDNLGLTVGQNYTLDIFQAERHTGGSSFSMTTSLQLVSEPPPPPPPSDVTPPSIVPTVAGTLGSNDWYTSDVNVSWTVTDAESPVSSRSGCDATSVTADTDGVTFTCSATSAGGTASRSVTVKRDASAPEVTGTVSGTQGSNGWYTSNVTVTWAVSDGTSGIGSSTGCTATTTSTDNTGTTYTCTATNGAGLSTTKSVSAKRDASAPSVTGTVSGTVGNNGWYTSDVLVSWSVSDGTSGIGSSTGCSATTTNSDNSGTTYTCTATNGAGLTATKSVSAKRDATNPVVAYAGNAGSYTVDQTVAITCSASDAMSGLASNTCANVGGDAYTFNIGANNYSASATDNAGNTDNASASFTVAVTGGSLCNLVKRWVSNAGVANSMCVKIEHESWGALRNELSAQSGKKISAANAAILLRLVDLMG